MPTDALTRKRVAVSAFIVGYLVDIDGLSATDAEKHAAKVLAGYERTTVTSWIDGLTQSDFCGLLHAMPDGAKALGYRVVSHAEAWVRNWLEAARDRDMEACSRDPLGFSSERLHEGELQAASGQITPWREVLANQRERLASGDGPANEPLAHLSKAERDRHELLALLDEATVSLKWLTHLAHGVGKAGKEPEPGEIEAAAIVARALLAKLEE